MSSTQEDNLEKLEDLLEGKTQFPEPEHIYMAWATTSGYLKLGGYTGNGEAATVALFDK